MSEKMNELENRIRAFANSEAEQNNTLAMLKVGLTKKDEPNVFIAHVIADVLLRFHGIPINAGRINFN